MDTASAVLEALLELLAMLLLLSLVSMEDMLVLADILPTLLELFMLPNARLRPMLDMAMVDMAMLAMDTAPAVLEAQLELLAMLLLLSLVSMEDMLVLADILPTLVELFMLPNARLRPMLDMAMVDLAMLVMDTASAALEALLELLAMLLLLSQVSMEDMLELGDIWQTLVELFMLPNARLRPMLDISMEDMAMVDMVWDMLVLAMDMVWDMAGVSSMVKQNLLRYFQAKLLFSTNSP